MLRSPTATVTFLLQRGDEAGELRSCTQDRNISVTCYSTVTMTVTFPGVTPHVTMTVTFPPCPRHRPHRTPTGTVPALRRTVYFLLHSISRSLILQVTFFLAPVPEPPPLEKCYGQCYGHDAQLQNVTVIVTVE